MFAYCLLFITSFVHRIAERGRRRLAIEKPHGLHLCPPWKYRHPTVAPAGLRGVAGASAKPGQQPCRVRE